MFKSEYILTAGYRCFKSIIVDAL